MVAMAGAASARSHTDGSVPARNKHTDAPGDSTGKIVSFVKLFHENKTEVFLNFLFWTEESLLSLRG